MVDQIKVPVPRGGGRIETREVETSACQKIKPNTEVYIRPIYETSMLHFGCDAIATCEYSYDQAYGGGSVSSYSTNIGSWYDEGQLMPTNGMSLEECKAACADYFGESYESMVSKREKAISNSPILAGSEKMLDEVFIKFANYMLGGVNESI